VFLKRSDKKEILDQDFIATNLLYRNLYELNFINTWLGGHAITLNGLKAFNLKKNKSYTVLEIGSGGGDNILYLARWALKNQINLKLTGVDLKQDCINYALNQCKDFNNINFICADYRTLINSNQKFDIIFSSLFCHHFNNNQLNEIFSFKIKKSSLGFFVNDLHRNPLAYHSIKLLTKIFSKSPLVKNDAPISVLRGFTKKELKQLLFNTQVNIYWKWAFRWLVIFKHHG